MGKLEKESKSRTKKENIQKIALAVIKSAGLLSVGLLAPNMIGAMSKLGIIERNRNYRISRSINNLLENGLVKFEKTDKGTFVRLTPAGEYKLNRFYKKGVLQKTKRWDKKWRIVIFDIKEKKRYVRDRLRMTLESVGFRRLQQSVWVIPYDCEDFINLMKADFKIGKDLLYIIADKIENDKFLRELFNLSSD